MSAVAPDRRRAVIRHGVPNPVRRDARPARRQLAPMTRLNLASAIAASLATPVSDLPIAAAALHGRIRPQGAVALRDSASCALIQSLDATEGPA